MLRFGPVRGPSLGILQKPRQDTSAPARNTPTEIDRLLQDSPASFLEPANGYLARANLKWSAMKDAPLEGLGWIHGFIPSSPLLFKRTVRRSRAQVKELKRAARAIYFQTSLYRLLITRF